MFCVGREIKQNTNNAQKSNKLNFLIYFTLIMHIR